MNNREWIEIKLTQEQLKVLEEFNIIIAENCTYVLGLGIYYKIIYNDNPYLEKYYMTSDINLLPNCVLEIYKEIIDIIYNKLNKPI